MVYTGKVMLLDHLDLVTREMVIWVKQRYPLMHPILDPKWVQYPLSP